MGHGRQWLTSEQARLQEDLRARRQRSGIVDAGFLVQELDANVGGGILAGALAFRLFLFMVPFVYIVFTVLGALAQALGQDPAQLARNAGITGILASAVVKIEDQGGWTQAALVLGALVTLFITSSALIKALYVDLVEQRLGIGGHCLLFFLKILILRLVVNHRPAIDSASSVCANPANLIVNSMVNRERTSRMSF